MADHRSELARSGAQSQLARAEQVGQSSALSPSSTAMFTAASDPLLLIATSVPDLRIWSRGAVRDTPGEANESLVRGRWSARRGVQFAPGLHFPRRVNCTSPLARCVLKLPIRARCSVLAIVLALARQSRSACREVNAEIAHISGERPGAPRFDSALSVEERNAYENFMLLYPKPPRVDRPARPRRTPCRSAPNGRSGASTQGQSRAQEQRAHSHWQIWRGQLIR